MRHHPQQGPGPYRVAPSHGPNGGVADSLDEVNAAVQGGVGGGWEVRLRIEKCTENARIE
jgi:hypothetical protein